jgi:hypothetical protein
MSIQVLKLTNNEEVLGESELSISGKYYTIKNPVGISIVRGKDGQPNIGFSPFPLHAEQTKDSTIDIPSTSVVYCYKPAQDFIDNYNQVFGLGIVLPKQKEIILG